MNLATCLNHMAHQLGLDSSDLTAYAELDEIGGYTTGWPIGSLWNVEGKSLYALVRALRPINVLEIGTMYGCSATHITQALVDNGEGHLTCVDSGMQIPIIGGMIPDHLRSHITLHIEKIEDFITSKSAFRGPYDFIFEDAMHSVEQVEWVYRNLPYLLRPGGVIVSHDAAHRIVGAAVREGIRNAGYEPSVYAIDPADCGLSVLRYEGADVHTSL